MSGMTRSRVVAAMAAALCLSMSLSMDGQSLAADAPPAATTPENPPVLGGSVGYFGEHGEIAISGDMKFSVLHQSQTNNSYTTFELQPALDYFVSTNVSVGGLLGISKDFDGRHTFLLGARGGYNVFLSNAASLWVRGGLIYGHYSYSGVGTQDFSGNYLALQIYAPLLWHPVPHFFLGAGPSFEADLISRFQGNSADKAVAIGVSSTIGGYFGGL
jgi:hypothetical protein